VATLLSLPTCVLNSGRCFTSMYVLTSMHTVSVLAVLETEQTRLRLAALQASSS
jgi:hypothetical protein